MSEQNKNAMTQQAYEPFKLPDIAAGEFDLPMNTVNELIFAMQPATLNTEAGEDLSRQERDALRAEKVRAVFADAQQ